MSTGALSLRREGLLNGLRHLLQFHRLVELRAIGAGDGAQGFGRDVAGQDDDRDVAMKFLLHLRRDFEPVHAVGQIEIRENRVWPEILAFDQLHRLGAVIGARRRDGLLR